MQQRNVLCSESCTALHRRPTSKGLGLSAHPLPPAAPSPFVHHSLHSCTALHTPMGSRWGQAQEAGYAPLPAGEEPAESPPPPPPSQSYQPAPRQHSFPHPHRQQHTALRIASDREHTVAQTLLAAAHQDAPALFAQLGTGTEGLGEEEAAARLARHGPNVIAMSGAAPWWR